MTEHHVDVEEVLEEIVAARRVGTDPKDLFGGKRGMVDSGLPALAYVVANLLHASATVAGWCAIGTVLVLVLVRIARRETLRHVFSGVLGVVIAVGVVRLTGGNKANYFLPGILINVAYCAAFLVSVVVGKPLVGVIMRLIWTDRPESWHSHPVVQRAYAEATVGWAATFALRVAVKEPLRRAHMTTALGIAHIALGYPLYLLALGLTLPYLRRRTASVPLPEQPAEGEAETGGGDAEDDAAEGVPDSLASG